MKKKYRLILSIVVLALISLGAFAQENTEYKNVILDGKPAKLNVATGEITLVNPEIKNTDNISEVNEVPLSESDFHVVKANENLVMISKTYKVSLTELKRANNLETTLVDEGQRLRVRNLDAFINTASDETYNASSENYTDVHVVVKNNTLFSIAKRYGLSVDKLKRLNNLTSNTIHVGQKLRVSNGSSNLNEESSMSVWTVASGDTLYSIALKNGTSVDAIKQLNGLTNNTIKVGQKLKLK